MTTQKSEFERELEKAIVEMLESNSTEPIEIQAGHWGREYGRNEKQIEFENLEGSLCPEGFGFEEYIRYLRKKVDRLKIENSKLRAALVSISKNSCCDTCQEAKLVALKALGGEE